MAIPKYDEIAPVLLKVMSDGEVRRLEEAAQLVATHFGLSDQERNLNLPGRTRTYVLDRTGWARSHLKLAGLLEYPQPGTMRITNAGRELLRNPPARITKSYLLENYEQFREHQKKVKERRLQGANKPLLSGGDDDVEETTPAESIRDAHNNIQQALMDEVLELVLSQTPEFFEQLVVDVLVRMGYGGSREEAGLALGRSGDEGVDGIINEDRLGLDVIYVQAKRWKDGTVGRPEVQKFAGALQGKRARKGVFITTSRFSDEAYTYASLIESKIILLDGAKLAELMVEHNVGVNVIESYEIKGIDRDYFGSE